MKVILSTLCLTLSLSACGGRTGPACTADTICVGGGYDFGFTPNDLSQYPPGYDAAQWPPGQDLSWWPGFDAGGYPPYDLSYYPPYDFGYPPPYGDMAHHHHHDMGGGPPPEFDLSPPPIYDFGYAPDLAVGTQQCEQCLQGTCGSQVGTCEADSNCQQALSCVIESSCFTYAGGSSAFANCVDPCVEYEGLTISEESTVLNEIAGLAACAGNCVDTCGGY